MFKWLKRGGAKRSCETCKWCEPAEQFRVLDPKDVMDFARCRCPKNRIHTVGDAGDWRWLHCKTNRLEPAHLTWFAAYIVRACGPQGRWWKEKP